MPLRVTIAYAAQLLPALALGGARSARRLHCPLVVAALSLASLLRRKENALFLNVFQIANTLEMERLVGYYEKQKCLLFSCCP